MHELNEAVGLEHGPVFSSLPRTCRLIDLDRRDVGRERNAPRDLPAAIDHIPTLLEGLSAQPHVALVMSPLEPEPNPLMARLMNATRSSGPRPRPIALVEALTGARATAIAMVMVGLSA